MRRSDCRWARKQKWRYLDKTLPAPLNRRVETHLAVCIPCRAEFTLAQDALNALAAGKSLTPEQQRVLQRPQARLSLSKVAAVAILALLLGASVYLWRMQGDWLKTLLSQRGTSAATPTAPPPAPSEQGDTPAATPVQEATIAPPVPPEPKPVEAAPAPAEMKTQPKPPQLKTSQRRPPAPQRRPTAPRPDSQSTTPVEGTVEVYDAAGNLIKREQVKEKR
ncbi:MAG: zf-HC2 domain-containing protein [Fimbriimonadales bacterium]|nr:zf-HC2 domain-containing protein [Fimbriimonadales bacterium]